MTPTKEKSVRVLIAGAGVGGLTLAIFLERAQIEYTILERSSSSRHVGGALGISAQSLHVFDQIGLLDELLPVSKPMSGIVYYNQKKEKIGRLDAAGWAKRYGYANRVFPRYELMEVLLRYVPPHKIQWGKKIQSTAQDTVGVTVVCTDSSQFQGDVLIGSDGAYSAVRRSMYRRIQEKGHKLSKSDIEQLRFEQFAILGVTSDISDEWPVLNDPTAAMEIIIASKDTPINVYAIPMPNGRVNWLVGGHFKTKVEDQDDFRFSDWESEASKSIIKEIEDLPITIGGTIGNLLRKTERAQITRTMLEDKLFEVWYDDRVCIMGDAVHKTLPAGGQGANQTVLDAVCLANLLHELPSTSTEDITRMFAKYRECRYAGAKRAVEDSAMLTDMMAKQGFSGNFLRSLVLDWMPTRLISKLQDALLAERPLLNFVPPIPEKGEIKDISKPHTLMARPPP